MDVQSISAVGATANTCWIALLKTEQCMFFLFQLGYDLASNPAILIFREDLQFSARLVGLLLVLAITIVAC